MKNVMLIGLLASSTFLTIQAKAQGRFNLNLNAGRPSWGLVGNHAGDYYYLPEIDSYYDIPRQEFIYFDGHGWAYTEQLPYEYRDYDLFGGFKVIINEPRPYLHADIYRQRYSRYYNSYRRPVMTGHGQERFGRYDPSGDEGSNKRYNNPQRNKHFDNKRREAERDGRFVNRWNGTENIRTFGRKW